MTDTSSILLVDDDADSLSVLASILAAVGYQVRSADSGGLALQSVAAGLPEPILLDVRMPAMDGSDVCQRLKAADSCRHVPVIFITAAGDVDERVQGLAAGAVDYISKPFHREELLARVRTHLELARLRRDLEKQVSERTADLRNTVDRLRESEQRFRNMADAAAMLIWVSSPDKLCTFVNKTWLSFTGRTLDEALGNGWSKAIHPGDLGRCVTAYTSAFDALQDVQMAFAKVRSDRNRGLLALIAERRPDSHDALAAASGRAKSNLPRTLATMARYGLVRLEKGAGRRFRPVVTCERVELKLNLAA